MAIISLGAHWRAVSDAHGWALEELLTREARRDDPERGLRMGDKYTAWVPQKYYGRLEQVITMLPELQLRRLDADHLHDLIAEMQRFRDDVLAALQGAARE